jgi:hypothetical protein
MANAPVDPKTGRFTKKSEPEPAPRLSFTEPREDGYRFDPLAPTGLPPAGAVTVETPNGDLSPISPAMAAGAFGNVLNRKREQLKALEAELNAPARVTDAMGNYIGLMPHVAAQREVMAQEITRLKGEIEDMESLSPAERLRYVREHANVSVGRAGIQVIL